MNVNQNYIKWFCKTNGIKSILQTKTQILNGINLKKLKLTPLKNDTINFSKVIIPETKVTEILEQGLFKIPQEDKAILCQFKQEYNPQNLYLRSSANTGNSIPPRQMKVINELDRILNQNIGVNTTLYRGAPISDFGIKSIDDPKFLSSIKIGKILEPPVYMSTSRIESTAKGFCYDNNSNVLLKLKSKPTTKGVYVTGIEEQVFPKTSNSSCGLMSAESEVLINRKQPFIIENITEEDGLKIIEGSFL